MAVIVLKENLVYLTNNRAKYCYVSHAGGVVPGWTVGKGPSLFED